MTDDEILKQNRESLLSRIAAYGGYYDDYPYGLVAEASDEIKLLRKERDEARRLYCMEKANPPPVNYSHRVSHNAVASHHNWDCFKEDRA